MPKPPVGPTEASAGPAAYDTPRRRSVGQLLGSLRRWLGGGGYERRLGRAELERRLRLAEDGRREAGDALASFRDGINALLLQADTATLLLDHSGRILRVSPPISRQLALSNRNLGRPAGEMPPELAGLHLAADIESVLGTGQPRERDVAIGERTYWRRVLPLRGNPDPSVALAVIWTDITTRAASERGQERRIEALTRQLADLDQFTNLVAHDLKAPLRGIDHLARWVHGDLEDPVTAAGATANLRLLRERVSTLNQLLDDLLAYARLGREGLRPEAVAIDRLLDEILALLAPPHSFTIRINANLPPVPTQRTPLASVLRNLLGNAIKHHAGEQGRIEIDVRRHGQILEVVITDDGPGIAPAEREQIQAMFEPPQAPQAPAGGLGLAIVRRILAAHGGSLAIESPGSGAGTAMRLRWPLAALEPNAAAGEERRPPALRHY